MCIRDRLVHVGAAVGDPGVVAQRGVVVQRHDHDPAGLAAATGADGQLDRFARRADQQRRGAAQRVDLAAVDADQGVTGPDGDAGRGQRRAGGGVGGLAGNDPDDPPRAAVVAFQVGAEQALRPAAAAPAGREHVGVRGAHLALDLPQQVHQVRVTAQPVDQRAVAVEHALPVDAAHVGAPEVVAHEPTGLGVGLAPLGGAVHDHPDAGQVDVDGVGRVVVGVDLAVGRHEPQRRPVGDHHPLAVAGHRVGVHALREDLGLELGQVEPLQHRARRPGVGACQVVAEHADERAAQPQQVPLGRGEARVPGGGDRDRDDPVRQALQVHDGDRVLVVGVLRLVRRVVVADRAAQPVGVERRRRGRGQRQQVRAAAGRERHVEHVRVVHRVEAAHRQERQVAAVLGERGREVGEPQRRHVHSGQVRGVGHPDVLQRPRAGVRPRDPVRVRRERQVADQRVRPVHDLADLTGLDVDQQQPAVVGGDRDAAAVRRDQQLVHAAEQAVGDAAGRVARFDAADRRELQAVLALGVGHPHDLAALADHPRQPGAHTGLLGQGADGAVLVGDPVDGAADLDDAGAARLVGAHVLDVAGGRHVLGAAGVARPRCV